MAKKKKEPEHYQINYAVKEFVLLSLFVFVCIIISLSIVLLSLDHLLAPKCNNVLGPLDFQSNKTTFA